LKDDQHLDDEGDAEEKAMRAPGVAAAPLEGLVVEAIGDDTEQEEQRAIRTPASNGSMS